MTIEYSVLQLFKPWLLGYCNCECGGEVGYCHGQQNKFINGHHQRGIRGMIGSNHPNWKGGRRKDNKGYWRLQMPDYFSSYSDGSVNEHVYFYQEYHKLCMLPWGHVHHIDGNTDNNMPHWNLQGLMKRKHNTIHKKGNTFKRGKHQDTSDRKCYACRSTTTRIHKPRGSNYTPYPLWYHLPTDKINWYCSKCYEKDRRKRSA